MTSAQAIEWLEKLAQWFEARASDSQEDSEIQANVANAKGARDIAKLIVGFSK